MDAPVSGGEPKAIDGTISVMVGGSKENFDKYYDLLMAMAGSVVYVGELGSGNVAKLANQVIVALNIAAVSEALTLAVKMMQIRSLYTKLSAEVLQDLQCLMQKHQ